MKKIALILALLLVVGLVHAADPLADKNLESGLLFLDLPVLSAVHHNNAGEITSFTGVNGALGISHRQFFNPVKVNDWNAHWDIGTLILILPYIGIGTDYIWDNGWYAGIGTIYLFPEIHAGVYF